MDETLTEIVVRLKLFTDKFSGFRRGHCFLDVYDRLFTRIRYKPLSILELGILHGGSLRLWEEYFPNAKIHGIDISSEHCFNMGRIKSHCGNYTDIKFIISEFKDMKFDIIIDDGEHSSDTQVKAFKTLYPYLNKNGLYIIEDIQTIDMDKKKFEDLCDGIIIDRRDIKHLPDDVIMVYRKRNK